MTCPNSWTAFDGDFPSSRCAQRPRRPPTQMMPNPRDHTINAITTLTNAVRMLSSFVVSTLPGVSNTSCTFFFDHHSFFSGSRRLQDTWYISCCILLVFNFCHARGSVPLYPPLPLPVFHAFCPPLCAIPSRFCTHLPLGYPHTRLPFGYPGMTDTYDACTHSLPKPFLYPCFIIHITPCYRCSILLERLENEKNLIEHRIQRG